MMTVKLEAHGFGPEYPINGHGHIATTWPEMVHAAITVGRRCWRDVFQHGRYSAFEICYRAAMLRANLQHSHGQLRRSDSYRHLDPSEKAAASYFIGLTLAKLMAGKLLGVPWLMHLDVYHHDLQPVLLGSGRPDLVGLDARNQWHVIEAKGRSNGLDARVVPKAKEQTRKLRTVCGRKPILRVASVAHFYRDSLSLRLEDPVGQDEDAVDWPFTEDGFLRDYYDPFVALIGQNGRWGTGESKTKAQPETVNGTEYLISELPDFDLEIGLDRRIYELYRSANDVRDTIRSALDRAFTIASEAFERVDDPTTMAGDMKSEWPRWHSCASGPHVV